MLLDRSRVRSIAIAVVSLATIATAILIDSCRKGARVPRLDKMTNGIFLEEQPPRAKMELRGISDNGLKLTEDSEGFVPSLYDDAAGYCSIAFGHLIKKAECDGSEPPEFQGRISKLRGTELLIGDMAAAQTGVLTAVTTRLTDGEYAALCDFVYNVGRTNFRNSTLRKVVNNNQLDRVPGQFRRWALAGGKPRSGLQTRREREIVLFFDGLPKLRGLPPVGENLTPIDITVGER